LTLTDRLSASFLGALALILVGFSAALYILTSVTLNRSVDDRLDSTLATLAVLAEDEPGGLDWERDERTLSLGRETGHDQVRWLILDERGTEIDRSKNLGDSSVLIEPGSRRRDRKENPWRVAHRRLRSSRPTFPELGDSKRSQSLLLSVGLPLEPIDRPLRNLAMTLPLLSTTLWGLTALVGRRLCKTALAPLTRMAASARGLGADEPGRRLPVAETGDELQDLAFAFNGLLDRWHEALERQSRFSGDASHQLRTPLAALIGQVDVALRRDRPAEEYRRTLARVRDQSDRLRRIVESLLYLARADAEAGLPSLDVFDLSPWVTEHVRRRKEAEGDEVFDRWEVRTDGPCFIKAQPALLAEVLDNLLDNALAYGRGAEPVEISVAREAGWVSLVVEDHGRGIEPGDLPRIFDPFFRAKDARRAVPGGSGLGLAVARRITMAFGGRLEAQSWPGQGSRFLLFLPSVAPGRGSEKGQAIGIEDQTEANPV
jgi:two-component system OmpR family sensor kinase